MQKTKTTKNGLKIKDKEQDGCQLNINIFEEGEDNFISITIIDKDFNHTAFYIDIEHKEKLKSLFNRV